MAFPKLVSTGLLALALIFEASAQQCLPPADNGFVLCNFFGPQAGTFVFPSGVSSFIITAMSSGNGGDITYTPNVLYSQTGGYGAQLAMYTGDIPIPDSFEMEYFVGGNGASVETDGTSPPLIIGPPLSGAGRGAGSGGGPSFVRLPNNQIISLGGGGGAGTCSPGGSAGTGPLFGLSLPGSTPVPTVPCDLTVTSFGGGGGAALFVPGLGGFDLLRSLTAQPGQLDGTGGDANDVTIDFANAGGGGGSFRGGATYGGSGGGGGSYTDWPFAQIVSRADSKSPVLQFVYYLPAQLESTTVTETLSTTTTLATVTSSFITSLTSTAVVSSTTQDPLSFETITLPTDTTVTATNRRSKAFGFSTTVVTPTSTITAVETSLLPPSCVSYEVVYPDTCCPSVWTPMTPVCIGRKLKRGPANDGVADVDLAKRTGLPYVSETIFGSPSAYTTTTSTATESETTVIIDPAPTTVETVTTYDPTVTSTAFFNEPAETETATAFSTVVETVTAAPVVVGSGTRTVTGSPTLTTTTTTTTAQGTACATQVAVEVTACPVPPADLDGFYRSALANIKRLKQRASGRQVLVNCGSFGFFLY